MARAPGPTALASFIAIALLGVAPVAVAAPGDLTPVDCVDDNDIGNDACAQTVDGLGGGPVVAMSANGRSLYAASFSDDAVVRFDRDPATGVLTPQGCIDDNDTGPETCADSMDGLGQPRGIAVSPDGGSVYVVSQIDDSITHLKRDPTTGALTPAGCIDDSTAGEGPDGCATSTLGMNGALGVEVSPNSDFVYVSSDGDDAVVTFSRDTGTGALTPVGCVDDNDAGSGPDACTASVDGLNGAAASVVTSDGLSLYTVGSADDAVVRFNRDPSTGALTGAGCIDDNDSGPDTCAGSTDGLDLPVNIRATSDGSSLYVAGNADDAVVHFSRELTAGALTPAGCIDIIGGPETCASSVDGLNGIFDARPSPDGGSVFTASQQSGAVANFDRAANGALTADGCFRDNDNMFADCGGSADALAGSGWLAPSPDGGSLYVGAGGDSNAVVRFGREPGGPGGGGGPAGPGSTGGGGGASSGGAGGGGGPSARPDPEAGCLNADAAVKGKRLGPAQLGRTRAAQRKQFKDAVRVSNRGLDTFCARGGGAFRVGYPNARLDKGRTKKLRKSIKDKVVLTLASSPRFSVKGVKPGDAAKRATAKLKGARKVQVGKNTWYVSNAGGVALLVKVRGATVREVGLGDGRLTRGKGPTRRFLTAWKIN